MELVLTAISSFLGGSLITCMVFVFGFSNKVTAMSTSLESVCKRFDEHLVSPPQCLFHQKLETDVAVLKSELHGKGLDANASINFRTGHNP